MQSAHTESAKPAGFSRLLSGNVCLEFINTLDLRKSARPIEHITSYHDLVAWGEHARLFNEAQQAALSAHAAREPQAALAVFNAALELREALYRIFRAVAHNQTGPEEDIELLKRVYLDALHHASLRRTDAEYAWHWPEDAPALEQILWSVAYAATELLCSKMLVRLKECPGADDCGWLFLDTSKNGTRRWCSMETCGSRVKMRRQYARKHKR